MLLLLKYKNFQGLKNPAFKVWADFASEIGILQSSAQITVHYTLENLIGKEIVGCINLGVKNIAGFMSEFLLVGFSDKDCAVCLMSLDIKVPNGKKAH